MHHDNLLLTTGLVRTIVWVVGAGYALRFKRWMVACGFFLAGVNGVAFAFANAHYHLSPGFVSFTAYISPLFVALIVAGFIFGTASYSSHKRWTP